VATKIQITITKDIEHGGTDAGMLDAYRRVLAIGELPTRGIVLTIECGDQDAAGIRDEIAVALTDRALGIDVKIKRTQEEEVERRRMVAVTSVPTSTPMERVWRAGALRSDGTSQFAGDVFDEVAKEWNKTHPDSPATVHRAPRQRQPSEDAS